MSYAVKIELCDDDSIITEIETEVSDIKEGEELIGVITATMENFWLDLL